MTILLAMKFKFCFRLITIFAFLFLFSACTSQRIESKIPCEIGIVGGGAAGVYLAYRLAPKFGERICLFEKEAELGGRMRDEEALGPRGQIRIGTGARRVNSTQDFVQKLAQELEIQFETPEPRPQLMQFRGNRVSSSEKLRPFFPHLPSFCKSEEGTSCEDKIYERLLEHSVKSSQYPIFKNYINAVAGKNAWAFLRASSRFHGDFDYEISTTNYLDYLRHELALSATNLYPIGGMSAFIRGMRERSRGVRFFLEEPVLEIGRFNGGEYFLRTSRQSMVVKRLVLAIPPAGLDKVGGNLAQEIRSSAEYKSLLPIPIVVINQIWSKAWWDATTPWRAWSSDHCVTHTEIPQEAYAAEAKVTRSVYTDNPKCVKHWKRVFSKDGIAGVEREVGKGLSSLFGKKVPKPVRTNMHFWAGGWYYVKAGSQVSNRRISNWAVQPLAGDPNLMLSGEAYWPDRPGWSEGAYFSAQRLLREKFGLD